MSKDGCLEKGIMVHWFESNYKYTKSTVMSLPLGNFYARI